MKCDEEARREEEHCECVSDRPMKRRKCSLPVMREKLATVMMRFCETRIPTYAVSLGGFGKRGAPSDHASSSKTRRVVFPCRLHSTAQRTEVRNCVQELLRNHQRRRKKWSGGLTTSEKELHPTTLYIVACHFPATSFVAGRKALMKGRRDVARAAASRGAS